MPSLTQSPRLTRPLQAPWGGAARALDLSRVTVGQPHVTSPGQWRPHGACPMSHKRVQGDNPSKLITAKACTVSA